MQLLFVSTPVGPLGTGSGGGVELTIENCALALEQLGHQVTIAAPSGSTCGKFPVIQIDGACQPSAQTEKHSAFIVLPENSVLANLWSYARSRQADYDIILNFAYDWLPFYLTPFFSTPIFHLVSMASLTNSMDGAIARVVQEFPGTVAVHTRVQADTFTGAKQLQVIGNGFDLSRYTFCPDPEPILAWVGRIAPEKGLEDSVAAAYLADLPLKIWGIMENQDYWKQIQERYLDATIFYEGFLPTTELQNQLGRCQALLMTPRWIEAFGNVVIEALACGVPVIAYRRGGPGELVESGKTGWLVEPDSVAGLVEAIGKLDQINRAVCRQQAEAKFSLMALGVRLENWLIGYIPH
jgi:UDP-glucose:tetrahydrobiopterin glucosyltransferase